MQLFDDWMICLLLFLTEKASTPVAIAIQAKLRVLLNIKFLNNKWWGICQWAGDLLLSDREVNKVNKGSSFTGNRK